MSHKQRVPWSVGQRVKLIGFAANGKTVNNAKGTIVHLGSVLYTVKIGTYFLEEAVQVYERQMRRLKVVKRLQKVKK